MKRKYLSILAISAILTTNAVSSEVNADTTQVNNAKKVYIENYVRAETDVTFLAYAKQDAFGKFNHFRQLVPIDDQKIVRMNYDTLYSYAIFDVGKCPVTITKPDSGKDYMSIEIFNQDHFAPFVLYKGGDYTITEKTLGSRYGAVAVRTLVNVTEEGGLEKANKYQDGLKITQECKGDLSGIPNWDKTSLKEVKKAINNLAAYQKNTTRRMGINRENVDPIKHFIVSASGWGPLQYKEARYLNIYPPKNTSNVPYTLTFEKPDVNYSGGGFWSITVYDKEGYLIKNSSNTYVTNDRNAIANSDGTYTVHFGGDPKAKNYMPIENVNGWNYTVRLYRPNQSIIDNPSFELGVLKESIK